jgi:quercetin dioxygenase-like cupin family protein
MRRCDDRCLPSHEKMDERTQRIQIGRDAVPVIHAGRSQIYASQFGGNERPTLRGLLGDGAQGRGKARIQKHDLPSFRYHHVLRGKAKVTQDRLRHVSDL